MLLLLQAPVLSSRALAKLESRRMTRGLAGRLEVNVVGAEASAAVAGYKHAVKYR